MRTNSRTLGISGAILFSLTSCRTGIAADSASAGQTASSFQRFFVDGGPLVWLLLLLSVLTVKLITQYFLLIRRGKLVPPVVVNRCRHFLQHSQFDSAASFLNSHDSLLSETLRAGLAELDSGRAAMDNAMLETVEQRITNLMRRIEWLNIIGNVAPMIGLFGTVWGMINAFNGIVQAGGQPEPADLAGGISVALVTTWWGLIVAIPALAAYGILRNRIDSLSAEAAATAENLLHRAVAAGVAT